MVIVKKQQGESDDRLIMRFRNQVLKEGIVQEYRDRFRHETDSEKRKKQKYAKDHKIKLEKKRNY